MNVQFCKCGSPLSNYDVQHHGNCHDCRVKESQAKIRQQYDESVERKRLEKEKKEADRAASKKADNDLISRINGKIVASAEVNDWHDYDGTLRPSSSIIRFTDGTDIVHEHQDYGSREYSEHCLDIDINTPCTLAAELADHEIYMIWNLMRDLVPSHLLPPHPTEAIHMEMIHAARKDFIRHIHDSIESRKDHMAPQDPA